MVTVLLVNFVKDGTVEYYLALLRCTYSRRHLFLGRDRLVARITS